jgi:hypothetical protein
MRHLARGEMHVCWPGRLKSVGTGVCAALVRRGSRGEPQKLSGMGVVGYGHCGPKHVRVLAELPRVEATVIETRPDRFRDAMTAFPAIRVASRLGEVQDELDAVVATPPRSHRPRSSARRAGRPPHQCHIWTRSP